MNRSFVMKWPTLALCALAAACNDTGVEPRVAPSSVSASLIGVEVFESPDTTVTQFTIDPNTGTTFVVGKSHALYIPAHAVCDVATSSYGLGEWEKACAPMTKNLVITAKSWKNAQGLPQVDFSPSLRFNPATEVTLFLKVNSKGKLDRSPEILYCAVLGAACIDEQLTDPSLTTHVDRRNSFAYRRIKHFSGYLLSSGRESAGMID